MNEPREHKKYDWVTNTKNRVEKYKKKNRSMIYVLPLEKHRRCAICKKMIYKDEEVTHKLDEEGKIKVVCSDNCLSYLNI